MPIDQITIRGAREHNLKDVTLSIPRDRIVVFTAQPGRIKQFVPIPLPRPRNIMELQGAPEYGDLVHRIWGDLRDEVQRAREIADGLGAPS